MEPVYWPQGYRALLTAIKCYIILALQQVFSPDNRPLRKQHRVCKMPEVVLHFHTLAKGRGCYQNVPSSTRTFELRPDLEGILHGRERLLGNTNFTGSKMWFDIDVTRPSESAIQILMTSLVWTVFSCKHLAPINKSKFVWYLNGTINPFN